MEFIQTEIRQPASLPVTINVPNYPRLAELKAQVQRHTDAANDCRSRLATLTRENILLNQQAESDNPSQQVFDRLAALKREIRQLETELAGAESQANRVRDELEQWTHNYAWNLYRRRLLARELAEVAGSGPTTAMQATPVGQARPRTKLEILIDLKQAVQWLAVWTGDPELAAETAKVEVQLAAAYQAA